MSRAAAQRDLEEHLPCQAPGEVFLPSVVADSPYGPQGSFLLALGAVPSRPHQVQGAHFFPISTPSVSKGMRRERLGS